MQSGQPVIIWIAPIQFLGRHVADDGEDFFERSAQQEADQVTQRNADKNRLVAVPVDG